MATVARGRSAWDHGVGILHEAWTDAPPALRAARLAAQGDMQRTGINGVPGWRQLAEGDAIGALQAARSRPDAPTMALLEAEALILAGAVRAGVERLEALHDAGDPAACLALARRRHLLGDHRGAERVAMALPMHAHVALTGARAALVDNRTAAAMHFIEPYLQGIAPLPESMAAGAVAMVAAAIMARRGEMKRLQRFAERLLAAVDVPGDMMPAVARVAWIGGCATRAWGRFDSADDPWMAAARLELALLAGDGALAERLAERAGPLAAPSAPALALLCGKPLGNESARAAEQAFAAGTNVHLWRTHPHRWQPWIDAALATPANVEVFDLGAGELPDAQLIPQAVLDDGSLVELLSPRPPPAKPFAGSGVWIGKKLCHGVGIDCDWPAAESRILHDKLLPAAHPDRAAALVLGADEALAPANEGRPVVAIAPPGDPFWAGSLPESAWPTMRVVRMDAKQGWRGAAERAAAALASLSAS